MGAGGTVNPTVLLPIFGKTANVPPKNILKTVARPPKVCHCIIEAEADGPTKMEMEMFLKR